MLKPETILLIKQSLKRIHVEYIKKKKKENNWSDEQVQ